MAPPIPKTIFYESRTEGSSLRQVTAWLRENGSRGSRRGELVTLPTVQRALTDPFYAGLVVDENGKHVTSQHDPIVDLETFFAVQLALKSRRTSGDSPRKHMTQ